MNAIKITVERGNKQEGMKKAVAYCDTGAFKDGSCYVDKQPFPCRRDICCVICDEIFICEDVCARVQKEA